MFRLWVSFQYDITNDMEGGLLNLDMYRASFFPCIMSYIISLGTVTNE